MKTIINRRLSFITLSGLFIIGLSLTGCTEIQFLKNSSYPLPEYSVFEYYNRLKELSTKEIQQEQITIEQRNIDPVIQKIQLAMALSMPNTTTMENEKQAKALLENTIEISDEKYSSIKQDYIELAVIWHDVLQQRQELREKINALNTDLTEKQKLISTLQEENSIFLEQIEALKTIEKQINNRAQSRDSHP